MKVTKVYQSATCMVLLPLALICINACCRRPAVATAICECKVIGSTGGENSSGANPLLKNTVKRLIDVSSERAFQDRIIEVCSNELKLDNAIAVSNAVATVVVDPRFKSDIECHIAIIVASANKPVSVAVANAYANDLEMIFKKENQAILEKSLSQIINRRRKLERKLAKIKAKRDYSDGRGSELAKQGQDDENGVINELKEVAADESYVRNNCLRGNCSLKILIYAK